jgi:hypothetical protein
MQPRVLVIVPEPHFTEHALNAPYADHLLLTIGVPHAFDSVEAPEHPLPQGSVLIQDRVLVIVPEPHFVEHPLHAPKPDHLPCTIAVPQDFVSDAAPAHGAPQELPAMQPRVLVCVPKPHFTEHALHPPYAPHLLSTIAEPHDLDSEEGPEHGAPQELPPMQPRVLV